MDVEMGKTEPGQIMQYSEDKYVLVKSKATDILKEAIASGNFNGVIENIKQTLNMTNEAELKNVVENLIRGLLMELLVERVDMERLERVFKFSIDIASVDLCPRNLPVQVVSDMLDGSPLIECEKIFSFVENSAEVFKKDIFFKICKNHLLRSCNDLLRRLSRSQNTVFCGRILLFLARIFPFSERSGLNINSEFNLENTTKICPSDDEILQYKIGGEDDEDEIVSKPVTDYNLYRKFWCLQEFFRNPTLCYNKLQWRHFSSYATEVLTIFGNFKSDSVPPSSDANSTDSKNFAYFAKFLTSPKLLELELSDSNFQRCVLLQFLILFQYLQNPVKFKLDSYVLTEEQTAWVKDTTTKVYKYLADTPPNGNIFNEIVQKILKREEFWNSWKNEGCPDFKTSDESSLIKPKTKKIRLGDLLDQPGKVVVGNEELNRLWNICPDNLEACRSKRRKFVPSLEKYFENAIKQADPANNVLEEEKDISDPNFCWKGLLLLAKKSPLFFSVNNTPYKTTAEYIEAMIQKIPKESSEIDNAVKSEPLAEEAYEDGNDEMLQTSEADSPPKEDTGGI